MINGSNVILPYTGVFTFVLSVLLLIGLYILVRKSKLGRAMRAVALDKKTAALMGVDVDRTISLTFIISGALAGAAGVMWGIHNGLSLLLCWIHPRYQSLYRSSTRRHRQLSLAQWSVASSLGSLNPWDLPPWVSTSNSKMCLSF